MICRKIQTKRRPPIQRSQKAPSRRGSRAQHSRPAPGVRSGPLLEFLALHFGKRHDFPMPQDTAHLAVLFSYLLDSTLDEVRAGESRRMSARAIFIARYRTPLTTRPAAEHLLSGSAGDCYTMIDHDGGASLMQTSPKLVLPALLASAAFLWGQTPKDRRLAHLRRRPGESKYRPAGPDQRLQLQQARSGLALQDRQPRQPPGVQARRHAADGQRRDLRHRPDRAAPPSRSTPATGELLWVHGEHEGARGAAAPRQLSGRGLAYWTDGKEERILYVTPGYRLIALDAKTGAVDADLRQERRGRSEARRRPDDPARPDHRRDRAAIRAGGGQGHHHHRRGVPRRHDAARPCATTRATCAASTCAPASACGSSTPFR